MHNQWERCAPLVLPIAELEIPSPHCEGRWGVVFLLSVVGFLCLLLAFVVSCCVSFGCLLLASGVRRGFLLRS